jgi:predicted DNA-binding protein YlxM (UPF0122 family)
MQLNDFNQQLQKAAQKRAATIRKRYLKGEQIQEIADDLGLTRQRVYQIVGPIKSLRATRS